MISDSHGESSSFGSARSKRNYYQIIIERPVLPDVQCWQSLVLCFCLSVFIEVYCLCCLLLLFCSWMNHRNCVLMVVVLVEVLFYTTGTHTGIIILQQQFQLIQPVPGTTGSSTV